MNQAAKKRKKKSFTFSPQNDDIAFSAEACKKVFLFLCVAFSVVEGKNNSFLSFIVPRD